MAVFQGGLGAMFDAEGAEITTNIAVKNRHKFKLSTDYDYAK